MNRWNGIRWNHSYHTTAVDALENGNGFQSTSQAVEIWRHSQRSHIKKNILRLYCRQAIEGRKLSNKPPTQSFRKKRPTMRWGFKHTDMKQTIYRYISQNTCTEKTKHPQPNSRFIGVRGFCSSFKIFPQETFQQQQSRRHFFLVKRRGAFWALYCRSSNRLYMASSF